MSQVKKKTVIQKDGYQTLLYIQYSNSVHPKGSILLLHGMTEHHGRYQLFSDYLTDQGYDVYRYDHRGHGLDKKKGELGFIDEKYGDHLLISDGLQMLKYVKRHSRSHQVILIGHSMGSLIGRNIIQLYDKIDCAVFLGTANPTAFISLLGLTISSLIHKTMGAKSISKLLHHSMFENRTYQKICRRTPFDWLSRDPIIVDDYIHDPFCGFPCTTSFLKDIIRLSYHAGNSNRIKKTRRDLPIYFLSGSMDPVGNLGKDITKLYHLYQKLSFSNVHLIIYARCRHELLNERNKQTVMSDITNLLASI